MDIDNVSLSISDKAAKRVRLAFLPPVDHPAHETSKTLKELVAATMTKLESIQSDQTTEEARERARCASIAVTHLETAAMYAVKAATG